MKAEYYIAIGVLAIVGFMILMKNKGQQFLVNTEVPLPTEIGDDITDPDIRLTARNTVTRIPAGISTVTRTPTTSTTLATRIPRIDRIVEGDIISGTITEEIIHSPIGSIGPVLTSGVRVPIGEKSVFIPISNLTQI